MKKVLLLSVLLCGFVLNNGYCFDGEHKITEKDITPIIELIRRQEYLNMIQASMRGRIEDEKDSEWLFYTLACDKLSNIKDSIISNLKKFWKEFLTSRIPNGDDEGKTAAYLLGKGRFNQKALQTICDNSVIRKFYVFSRIISLTLDCKGIMDIAAPFVDGDEVTFNVSLWHSAFDPVICVKLVMIIKDPSIAIVKKPVTAIANEEASYSDSEEVIYSDSEEDFNDNEWAIIPYNTINSSNGAIVPYKRVRLNINL